MKQRLLAVLVSLVMALSLTVPAFAAPEDETSETTNATTTTRVTTSKDTSDEAIARATAEGGEEASFVFREKSLSLKPGDLIVKG